MTECTPRCWEPVLCPDHGQPMHPIYAAPRTEPCCWNHTQARINPRHLWEKP